MKLVLTGMLVVMIAFSLMACSGKGGGNKMRVKCPACGYEFEAPAE